MVFELGFFLERLIFGEEQIWREPLSEAKQANSAQTATHTVRRGGLQFAHSREYRIAKVEDFTEDQSIRNVEMRM